MLELINVKSGYGKTLAIKGISLKVAAGSIISILGANGAGKTTILKTVIGLIKAWEGSILFQGENIEASPTNTLIAKGISLVPEGRRIFSSLTVLENLKIGAYTKWTSRIEKECQEILELFPALKGREHQTGGTLSGGEQQMLAIARSLISKPKLLLLDEPSMGLSPVLVQQILELIMKLREQQTTILLVEQNARIALNVADYGYVLQTGEIILQDEAKKLAENPMVRSAYLGM